MKFLLASAFLFAALLPVHAQQDDVEAREQRERDRIKAERSAVEERFRLGEQACRQKFSVTDCVDRARRSRNADLAVLRRQELILNDAERQRRAAERKRELDERTSAERQQEAADKRAKALQEQQDRENRFNEKAAKRAEDQAEKAANPAAPRAAKPGTVEPQGKARAARAFDAQPAPSKAAENRAKFESNQQEAAKHKAEVLERAAKRTKPAASALPPPPP